MKKVANKRIITTKLFIEDNKLLFTFVTTVTLGVALGSIILSFLSQELRTSANSLINEYFTETKGSYSVLFIREIVSKSLMLITLYISGLSVAGLPVIIAIPLVEGLRVGLIYSYRYFYFGFNGFLTVLSYFGFSTALYFCLLLSSYKESFLMSLSVANGISSRKIKSIDYNCSFFTFTKRFIIYEFCLVIVSAISSGFIYCFSKIL